MGQYKDEERAKIGIKPTEGDFGYYFRPYTSGCGAGADHTSDARKGNGEDGSI